MNETPQIEALCQALTKEELPYRREQPLAEHTTFRIGGPAAVYCLPRTVLELARILELCRETQVRYYLLGNGSNTLFADAGFPGAVISMERLTRDPVIVAKNADSAQICVSAGVSLAVLCRTAQQAGLAGLEFAYGIPGTVGGAVYMNAGAYGGEVKGVLQEVSFLDEAGNLKTMPADHLQLGYRTSVFEKKPWCIVEAVFSLTWGEPQTIAAKMQELMARRKEKQPLDLPSAGSTFKRPEGTFAGKLIDDCGLRGFRVGGAQISEKHCGFVVNRGGATCADVIALTDEVSRIVKEKTGYVLEREIRVVE